MTVQELVTAAEADGWRVVHSTTCRSISFYRRNGTCVHYDMVTKRIRGWKPGDSLAEYTVSGVASIPAVLAILKGLLPKSQEPTMIDDPEQHDAESYLDAVKKHAAAGGTIVVSPALARRCGVDVFTLHGLAKGVGYASRVHLVKMPY